MNLNQRLCPRGLTHESHCFKAQTERGRFISPSAPSESRGISLKQEQQGQSESMYNSPNKTWKSPEIQSVPRRLPVLHILGSPARLVLSTTTATHFQVTCPQFYCRPGTAIRRPLYPFHDAANLPRSSEPRLLLPVCLHPLKLVLGRQPLGGDWLRMHLACVILVLVGHLKVGLKVCLAHLLEFVLPGLLG